MESQRSPEARAEGLINRADTTKTLSQCPSISFHSLSTHRLSAGGSVVVIGEEAATGAGAKSPLINLNNNNPNNNTLTSLPQQPLGHDHLTPSKPTLDSIPSSKPHQRGQGLCVYSPYWRGQRLCVSTPHWRGKKTPVCSVKKCFYPRKRIYPRKRPLSGRLTQVVRGSVGEQRLPSF